MNFKTFNDLFRTRNSKNELNRIESFCFDVIVVGSGAGGGALARDLIKKGKNVLVLEKGPLILHTHTLNIGRPIVSREVGSGEDFSDPTQDNDLLFKLFKDTEGINFINMQNNFDANADPSKIYTGGPVYMIGGRSTLWGNFAPMIPESDMGNWPPIVGRELKKYYDEARKVMFVTAPSSKDIESAKQYLQKVLDELKYPNLKATEASLAVEFTPNDGNNPYLFARGAWSSVDFLLSHEMTRHYTDSNSTQEVHILHSTEVKKVETCDRKVTCVVCTIDNQTYRFTGKKYVLAAGSINSPAIALRSGLNSPSTEENATIGKGITDHYIYYRYFIPNIRKQLEWKSEDRITSAVKIQSFFKLKADDKHHILLNIALNSSLYLSRPRDIMIQAKTQIKEQITQLQTDVNQLRISAEDNDYIKIMQNFGVTSSCDKGPIGALAFEVTDDLNIENSVSLNKDNSIDLKMTRSGENISGELVMLTQRIFETFGLEPVYDKENYKPDVASQGCVAHEVGTLRMGTDKKNSVVDSNLKFHDYDNLFACDLSVFPESPAANPTYTLVALALRLSAYLQEN